MISVRRAAYGAQRLLKKGPKIQKSQRSQQALQAYQKAQVPVVYPRVQTVSMVSAHKTKGRSVQRKPKRNTVAVKQQKRRLHTLASFGDFLTPGVVGATVAASSALYAAGSYVACKPNQYLVRTGLGIPDVMVTKKGICWPFQSSMIVDVNPTTYLFRLHNMSRGKVEFELPVVMTIGPRLPEEDPDAFTRYCKLLQDMSPREIEHTIKGIIEGETRGLTAQLTVEEMFNGKDVFREKVIKKLEPDLAQLGVTIYNANIQEMRDYDANNKYFEYRKQRAIQIASNEARRDVAEAQKQGDIDVSERERDTRIVVAQNEKDAKVEEYARRKDILEAEALVAQAEAETQKVREVSLIQANQMVELRKQELQREIEERRYEQMSQSERARRLAPALADAEAQERLAEAHLYTKTKEAEGIQRVMEAKAEGIKQLLTNCGEHPELAKFYLGVDSGLWHKVAEESARAVQNMKPRITQWTTGGGHDTTKSLVDLVQGVVPLYDQVKRHLDKR